MNSYLPLRFIAPLGLSVILASCGTPDATETPTPPPITIIPPSITVAPIPPTLIKIEGGNVDANKFTPGALPVSTGNADVTITPTPASTQAAIPMSFVMSDGLIIAGTYYNASTRAVGTVLLLHMLGSNKESWRGFATQLQAAGYNALAVDLRGHGETGGTMDWAKAPDDVSTLLTRLRVLPGVDSARVSVIGASIGANLALGACADSQACRSVVLLSPGLDYQGVKTADAMGRYGAHPVLITASRDDNHSGADSTSLDKLAKGDHTLKIFEGSVHGTALFDSQPDLGKLIIQWFSTH